MELDGVELELPRSRRGRLLLAWLALHPGPHPRGPLAARFWPDVLDESARSSLRAALAELRRALAGGAACLRATRDAVALGGPGLEVDVRQFAELLRRGELEAAVAACPGPLLTGLDDDWVHDARAEHAARLGAALAALDGAAAAAGDHGRAVRLARQAAALDDLDEAAHRRLMTRLAAAGDRAGALRTFDALAERLRATLAIAPSAATRALADTIRADASPGPADAPAPAVPRALPPPAALAHAATAPFVGREGELERLAALRETTRTTGSRRLVLLTGEPGIGKTRLALRFAAGVAQAGGPVLLGRCSAEPLGAYEPFVEILAHCDAALGAPAVAALAGPAADELARLRAAGPGLAGSDPGARHRLFDALEALLSALAGDAGLVLLVDDLQWADRGTLLLLRALLRSPRPAPVLVIATSRDGEAGPSSPSGTILGELRREGHVEQLALAGLDEDAVTTLATTVLGEAEARRRVPAILERSGGNAFFVGELVRAAAGQPEQEPVPIGVREVIGSRRARLGPAADALLVTAAVTGFRAELRPLLTAAGLPEAIAEDALEELVAARLLREADGELALEFPHALVRDAVYASLGALRRARLHRDVARALIADGAGRHVEQIAHHLGRGPDPADAVPYLEQAADRAMAAAAYEQAATFLASAVTVLDAAHAEDDPRVGPLLAGAGEALLHAADPAAADLRFDQAAAVARRTGDARLLARAALGRCGLGVTIGDVDPGRVALLEEALDRVADTDAALSSALLARLAIELYYAPSRDRSERLAGDAVTAAERSGDPRTTALALGARHVALWRPDRLAERCAVADAMIEAATVAGDAALRLQGHNWRAVDLFEAGDLDGWRREVARHGALAAALRLPAFSWYTPLWAAADALCAGRFEEAAALREQARADGTRAGDPNADLFAEMLLFHERTLRERLDGFDLGWVEDRITTAAAGFAYRPAYAWILAARGRTAEAAAQLETVVAGDLAQLPFDTNWLSALAEIGEATLLLRHRPAAETLLRHLPPYADRQLTAGRAVVTYGCGHRQLGHAAAVLGHREDAAAHYEAAARIDGAAGLRPWAERARAALGAVRAPAPG